MKRNDVGLLDRGGVAEGEMESRYRLKECGLATQHAHVMCRLGTYYSQHISLSSPRNLVIRRCNCSSGGGLLES